MSKPTKFDVASIGDDDAWVPVTYDSYDHVEGPFYHGTAAKLKIGDLLTPGFVSNYSKTRVMNHIYFSSTVASLAAQLAVALTGGEGRGHVYIVEPTGPFEDDPNVTNKRFKGNPTKSYRSKHPLRIVGEVEDWEGTDPEVVKAMVQRLAASKEKGEDLIED
jgi:rifampin ADP-ribosylating transferase